MPMHVARFGVLGREHILFGTGALNLQYLKVVHELSNTDHTYVPRFVVPSGTILALTF